MRLKKADSLQGLHLLVTRPADQAYNWARQLRELGAAVTVQPMLVIEPLVDKQSKARIIGIVRRLDEFQKAVFISQNAVKYSVEWLSKYWPQLPGDIDFFAIGDSTAVSLAARDVNAQSAGIVMNSEALLKLPAMQSIKGQKIVIFRGRSGRAYLGDRLSKRGALVEYCEVYRREPSSPQVCTLPPTFYKTERLIPITTVLSGETLLNLAKAILPSQLTWLRKQLLLTPGSRVAAIAAGAGFNNVLVARNATHKGMIEALYEWRQRQK